MEYTEKIPDFGDVFTVEKFKACVKAGGFIDYDGFGHESNGELMNEDIWVKPSKVHLINKDTTHIIWFNR